jgi:hypothetical protein
MKISQLIANLQSQLERNGDIDIINTDGWEVIGTLASSIDEKESIDWDINLGDKFLRILTS